MGKLTFDRKCRCCVRISCLTQEVGKCTCGICITLTLTLCIFACVSTDIFHFLRRNNFISQFLNADFRKDFIFTDYSSLHWKHCLYLWYITHPACLTIIHIGGLQKILVHIKEPFLHQTIYTMKSVTSIKPLYSHLLAQRLFSHPKRVSWILIPPEVLPLPTAL